MGHNYHHMCGCAQCCAIEEAEEREDEAFEADVARLAALPAWRENDDNPEQSAREEIEYYAQFYKESRSEAASRLLRMYT